MRARAVVWSLLVSLGCGGSHPAPSSSAPTPPAPASSASTPPAPAAVPDDGGTRDAATGFPGVPGTRAGVQLGWVLDVLVHRKGEVETAELQAHFDASFLAQVPAARLAGVLRQLAAGAGDLSIGTVEGAEDKLVAHVTAGGEKMLVSLVVAPANGRIVGLLFQPDLAAGPKPTSLEEAVKTIPTLAPKAQLLVARLERGRCAPLYQVDAHAELAIGSTFKLYVLLALADRIAAGKAHWADELAVRDDWKSLPSGITQDVPAGQKLSLRTFAERMISISDNTAADHLLETVGRSAVEAAVRASGHAKPALDAPFLSTREMFLLKLGAPGEMARYAGLSAKARRTYLAHELAGKQPTLQGVESWKTARHVDTIEWFASADDLCRVMATLRSRGQAPATKPVLDVLSMNPGLPIDKAAWPYVGFKGGSEPGVINLTYLLERADHAWFVVSLGFNAAEGGALDEAKIFGLASGVIELLGRAR